MTLFKLERQVTYQYHLVCNTYAAIDKILIFLEQSVYYKYETVFVGTNETVELNCYRFDQSECAWRISKMTLPSSIDSNATDKTYILHTDGHLLNPKQKNTNIDIIGGTNTGKCNLKIRRFSSVDEGSYTCKFWSRGTDALYNVYEVQLQKISNNVDDVKAILLVLLVVIAVVLLKAVWIVLLIVLAVVLAITVLTAFFLLRRKVEPVDNQLYISSDDPGLARINNLRNPSVIDTTLPSISHDNQIYRMQLHNEGGVNGRRSCTYINRGVVSSAHNSQICDPSLNYSEITFNTAPTMQDAVIHGSVNRTIYSEIDLTAEPVAPLSSSESEHDERDESDI
ncbi:unnamed protein product [Mytilus coruscus]|uniref:Ig-like domain-containing protein n=1 Tax=Mytilus coruscus TaxID=42192 RepID=A0A6J8AS87_MYTCO|nr:unnamed protein product [Mytilus coruscus]